MSERKPGIIKQDEVPNLRERITKRFQTARNILNAPFEIVDEPGKGTGIFGMRHFSQKEFKDDFSKAKDFFYEFLENEEGMSFDPNNILNIEGIKNKSRFLFLGLALLAAVPENASAQISQSEREKLTWVVQALEKIDPLHIVEFQNEAHEVRLDSEPITEEEQNILAWNMYHEARSSKEGEAGQLAVLLTTLNRMKNPNYPKTAQGVVFQKSQFSWTIDIKKGLHAKRTEDAPSYAKIRELVKKYTSKNITESTNDIVKRIRELGHNIDPGVIFYHQKGLTPTNPSTAQRISNVEINYELDPTNPAITYIGTQLYYK